MAFNEEMLAAAKATVEAAGGEVPEGATYNEVLRLAAATIIANGGYAPAPSDEE